MCIGHLARLFAVFSENLGYETSGFLSLTQIGPGLLVAGCDPAAALMTIAGNVLVNIFPTSCCPLALETLMDRGVSNRVKMVQIKT